MSEIEILTKIKKSFDNLDLNESDTRIKIIDQILINVLKWPLEPICTEKFINGNRADYVLKGKNERPLLIIESKRQSEYFTPLSVV